MSKTATLNLKSDSGSYTVTVSVKSTRIPCKKAIWEGDRQTGIREFMVPMKQATVTLTHEKGDTLTYRATWMGSKVGCTKSTNMVRPTVRNKQATGPADLETDTKPVSVTLDHARCSIARMTGFSLEFVATFFDVESMLALETAGAA
jgi:hypothetical protein